MLNGRSIQVKVVKDADGTIDIQPVDYEAVAKTITKSAILVIAAYLVGDTMRQLIIK